MVCVTAGHRYTYGVSIQQQTEDKGSEATLWVFYQRDVALLKESQFLAGCFPFDSKMQSTAKG